MPHYSTAIANEFLRRGTGIGLSFTQMQLQKLVYISHGWNLAINNERLTYDDPQAWDYGPVYRDLRNALRKYGSLPITREIKNSESDAGVFNENPDDPIEANLSKQESNIIDRVIKNYGRFHAYKLSALTHERGTPWSDVYNDGKGQYDDIPASLIREHFVSLASRRPSINS